MEIVRGMEIRTEVLQYSLLLENFTSVFLANLLDISDYKQSKSFGNKSGNLSFNQKIDLLIDIEALEKFNKNKFMIFMSIRNQFMHNIDAETYELCVENIDGADKFLLKTYPQTEKLNREQQLKNSIKELASDIITITVGLIHKVEKKIGDKVRSEILEEFQKNSMSTISEIETILNAAYDEKIKNGEKSINIEEVKNLGSNIRSQYYKILNNKTLKKKKN